MRRLILNILKTVAGLVAGCIVVSFAEAIGMAIWPVPQTIQNAGSDSAKISEAVAQIPLGAKLFVVLAWTAGPFVGGLVAGLLNGYPKQVRWVGILMLSVVLLTLMTFPHPLWMTLTGACFPLPATFFGGKLGCKWRIALKRKS